MYQMLSLLFSVAMIAVGPANALDVSSVVGTLEVSFQPMQATGIKEGCSLVYHIVGQDHAYRQGRLVSLVGNITFSMNKDRNNAGLSLKVGTVMSLDKTAKPEHPYFAYLQTPHGTTARSKFVQYDSPDTPGARLYTFPLDGEVMKVLEDIVNGTPVTIGFNRTKGGLDVLIPLDLTVAETTASDTGFSHRHSDQMLLDFALCNAELARQVSTNLNAK